MNNLLLFFAFPIATIILSISAQKILRNKILTAATFFAIYLILTFSTFDINFLIYAIIYTILAYVSALISNLVFKQVEKVEIDVKNDNFDANYLNKNYCENEKYMNDYYNIKNGLNDSKNRCLRR